MIDPAGAIYWGLIGTLIGIAISWLPGFHIYNVMALLVISAAFIETMPPDAFPFFAVGAVVAFAYLNAISTVYFSVADESTILMLFPSQRYLLLGKGHEATLLYLIGAFTGSALLAGGAVLFPLIIPFIYRVFANYITYLIAGIILFMFLSEWPKGGERGPPLRRLLDAWTQIAAGIFVFFASGLLGFIVMNTNILTIEVAFARLTPLFIGFFGMPWVIMNLISKPPILPQRTEDIVNTSVPNILHATAGGFLGGLMAAIFPIITGGMGALVAGHMTSTRGDDAFIISQGVNRVLYYVGAIFLLFMPVSRLTRGAAAWLVRSIYIPKSWTEYWYAAGIILLASGIAFLVTLYLSKVIARIFNHATLKVISMAVAIGLAGVTYGIAGLVGLVIMGVATAIGMTASLFNTRRSYCLGGIIFPVLVSMTGNTGVLLSLLGLR